MKEKTIKAIFFDLGNVIIKLVMEDLVAAFDGQGKVTNEKIIQYATESDNLDRYAEGKLTSSQFYSKTKHLFRLDMKYGEFYEAWNSMFAPYPEMEDIIRTIKKKYPQIKLILLSNTNESHFNFIRKKYKILDLMDEMVVSYEVGRQKPHPDIFKEALRVAGTMSKESFYTDDRADLIEAARVMGIRAFLFTGAEALREQLSKFNLEV
ncbi:MAG: HAD family phosphatase [Candidatus Tantalella remota]|nr:HAD family phosphatase [Candidatus Tantalella remota]